MSEQELQKYLKKINKKSGSTSFFKKSLSKLLICIILFLAVSILYKSNTNFHNFVVENFYNKNFNFTKVKNFYNKYLGGIFPLEKVTNNTEVVFNEELKYSKTEKFYDGVKLEVTNNYLVPVIKSGLVVYIGEKENYGNTIIIEGEDGVDVWYGNITNPSISLYDYVESGNYLGEADNTNLYLVFSQDGKYLDYETMLN